MNEIPRILILVVIALLTGCETIPPNSTEIHVTSTPSAAAVFSPSGKLMGVTPFTLVYQHTPAETAAGVVRGGNATAIWYSGASAIRTTDFNLNGFSRSTITINFDRPATPGVMQDVTFAENRERQSNADSQAGWAALAEAITARKRQQAAPVALQVPDIMKPPVQCTSTVMPPNQVVTTCK